MGGGQRRVDEGAPRPSTPVYLLLSTLLALAGPALLGLLFWGVYKFVDLPPEERAWQAVAFALVLLAAFNLIANYRLGVSKLKFWQWRKLARRARHEWEVAYRLAIGLVSSTVMGLWLANWGGFGSLTVKLLVIGLTIGTWPIAFMVRPLFGQVDTDADVQTQPSP